MTIRHIKTKIIFLLHVCFFLVACGNESSREGRSDIAVALGDSFISGEGAQDFITGDGAGDYLVDQDDYETPGLPADLFADDDPDMPHHYFCHRSNNSSIFVANLPGIDQRVNLACSGAEPIDIREPNRAQSVVSGGVVQAQLKSQADALLEVLASGDVDIILVGMGANNSISNFSDVIGFCHAVFMADAAGGVAGNVIVNQVIESFNGDPDSVSPSVQIALENNGCTAADFYSQSQLNTIVDEYTLSLARVISTLRLSGYAPGDFKLIVQGYASPFAPVPHADFLRDNGSDDSASRFAGLARERYAAGCPLHELSMMESDNLANTLSTIGRDAVQRIRQQFPDDDVIFMDVQRAFDGARLCENSTSPTGAFWNPIWFRSPSNNEVAREIPSPVGGTLAGQWAELALACSSGASARCQDAGHPNANGHAALGRCLSLTVEFIDNPSAARDVQCRREPTDGSMSVNAL